MSPSALSGFAPAFRRTIGDLADVDVAAALSEVSAEFDLDKTLFASVVVELESVEGIRRGDQLVAANR